MDTDRLILGTVQLGLPYGIANKLGQPDQENAERIIACAWDAGISQFDTAQGYGNAEEVLGKAFRKLGISNDVAVINKFAHKTDLVDEALMTAELESSLLRLGVPRLASMMLHSESQLSAWNEGAGDIFQRFVESGKIGSAGISIYSPEIALTALSQVGIDFIQIPGNVLDKRFERLSVFSAAESRQKQVYIRSVFLQGLLLMRTEEVPEKMRYVIPVVEAFTALYRELGLNAEELAIAYIKLAFPQCKVLLGVESVHQLENNLAAWQRDYPDDLVPRVNEVFSDVSENVTNWNFWPK
jgi:aryl-alcohol dehydrogenase-like predicted oxidoreductase